MKRDSPKRTWLQFSPISMRFMIKVLAFKMSKCVLIAEKHRHPIINKNKSVVVFYDSVQHNVTRGLSEKRKFISCQYQYTIQVNLRYPIFYDDQTLFVVALAKQGKKLQGKVKILISYACVSGSYRSYRRACWSYSQKS